MKDPYIQENGTLKNKLGITEYKELNNAEKDIGFVKLIETLILQIYLCAALSLTMDQKGVFLFVCILSFF